MRQRPLLFIAAISVVMLLLFLVPWLGLVRAPDWPTPVFAVATVVIALVWMAFPMLMFVGHGRQADGVAKVGDTILGVVWTLFPWAALAGLVHVVLALFGPVSVGTARLVGVVGLAIGVLLVVYGVIEAMRLPRVRTVPITVDRLGAGLDGLRVVVLADTHFGPFNRTRWAKRLVAAVNELNPDVVCHAGDLADGTVAARRGQVAALGEVRASETKLYITGNHEYFSEAHKWLDHMRGLGWQPMHNRHTVLSRGGDQVVLAGVDDPTGATSGLAGHGANLNAALDGVDPELPVVLLAHQPKQVAASVAAGVDLQISGHTHGGQIWPFHLIVRLEQKALQGLSRHGQRTQLYTSRGAGFWGPPLRVFAPSEISLLVLRSGAKPA